MTTLTTLFDDKVTEIRYVYHLSDIHIRNTQRHTEYNAVFDRTYEKIKSQMGSNNKTTLIVVTGDIMHLKTEMSPESVYMSQDFFMNLSKIAPVIIIAGNHDCNLSNKNRMDALTPIMKNLENTNVHYLKYSGMYQYNNIIFGVSSLLDNKFVFAKNITNEILKKIHQKNKYKIALYHGMLKGAKMDNGFVPKNDGLTIKNFNDYDYVMLGDLHTHQFVNSKKTMAYAGSLIQQTHGESLHGHGFLKWDLFKNKIDLTEVENDYGFCKLHIKDGIMVDTLIPKNPSIHCILENTTQVQYNKIKNNLTKKHNIVGDITFEIIQKYDPKSHQKYSINFKTDDTKTKNNKICDFLKEKKIKKSDRKKIIKIHNCIENKFLKDDECNTFNGQWKILELKFSNMLSYGKDNIIDFRNYSPNQIIGIVAPNFYGKSSILDILIFCIFDKFTREAERRDVLNKNKKEMYCSLLFEIGKQKYFIERSGKRSKSEITVKIDVRFFRITYDKNNNEIKESLTGIDKNDTNKIIINFLGNYNDYLTTNVSIQQKGKHNNFTDMTHLQKKEYLSDILKLHIFEQCCIFAKNKLKKYNIQLNILEKEISSNKIDDIKSNINKLKKILLKLNYQKNHITDNLYVLELSLILIKPPKIIKYHELSTYDLNSENDIMNTINILIEKNKNNDLRKYDRCIDHTFSDGSQGDLRKKNCEHNSFFSDGSLGDLGRNRQSSISSQVNPARGDLGLKILLVN